MDVALSITNIHKSYVEIINSKFLKNGSYGVFICNKIFSLEKEKTAVTLETKNSEIIFRTGVVMRKCEISHNKSAGIIMKKFPLALDLCKICENYKFSIEIPIEENKSLLKLMNYQTGNSINLMITNAIGGSWGSISIKKAMCMAGSCSIL
jgi:hypothetical protein